MGLSREEAITEAEDSGWLTYEDKQTCLEILYNLDDFESRTCGNCKWYKDIGEPFKVCKLYDIAHGKDFGCNKWKAKDEEV